MTKYERADLGASLRGRYNCSQAVLLAYADELPFDTATLEILGSTIGTGLGCMKATCGALLGAELVLAVKIGQPRGMNPYSRKLYRRFEEKCGATRCMDIKGVETGEVLCSCAECVRNAVLALEEMTETDE